MNEHPNPASRFYAENYERLYHTYLYDSNLTSKLADFLRCRIRPETTIIVDLGCGIGRQMTELSNLLGISPLRNLGVDFSTGMQARHDSSKSGGDNWLFVEGDFTDANIQQRILKHVSDEKASFVVFLCLGNTIGHLSPDKYQNVAALIDQTSKIIGPQGTSFIFIEYREGVEYKKLCSIPEIPPGITGGSINAYGSAEFLGQLGSDFYAFYIREDIDQMRYRVFLYSLSADPSEEERLQCSLSALMIENAFYVDGEKLISAFVKQSIDQSELQANSGLQTGRVIGFEFESR